MRDREQKGCSFIVEAIRAVPGGVEARLRLTEPSLRRTSAMPGIAEWLLEALPGITRHRCESGSPRGIIAEIADTESAHLIEHIALELLARGGFPRTMAGRTDWDFRRDGRFVYRVFLGCEKTEAAASALHEACALFAWCDAVRVMFRSTSVPGDISEVWCNPLFVDRR